MSTHSDSLVADTLVEKLRKLSPQRLAEVTDFIDFLQAREHEESLVKAMSRVSEPSFKAIWDNTNDAAYDRL